MDVVMEDGADGGGGRVGADQDADDFGGDGDSDNQEDDDEEMEEEKEEGGVAYTDPAKSARGVRGQQKVADSVFGAFSFVGDGASNVERDEFVKSDLAESGRWLGRDWINTARVGKDKQFVCVKCPALIRNKDKAVACLGGIDNIFKARKLGKIDMSFRPEDPYSKPAPGFYSKNNHVLVRCKRRKKRTVAAAADHGGPSTSTSTSTYGSKDSQGDDDDDNDDGYEYKVEVIGTVCGVFSFDRPCDFQYLPVTRQEAAGSDEGAGPHYQEILTDLTIRFEDDRETFMNRDVPLFVPPYVFSRSERPAKYFFHDDGKAENKEIGMARKMRHKGTYKMTFSCLQVPSTPHPDAVTIYETTRGNLDPLRKLFEERPLWSKTGVVSRLQGQGQAWLGKHIAMVAYLFQSGPWLHMWCRFGYDPRKHPESKMYQTVDLRIRHTLLRDHVACKRSRYVSLGRQGWNNVQGHRLPPFGLLANQGAAVATPVAAAVDAPSTSSASTTKQVSLDLHYQFSPSHMPPFRQMYYQVCDVMQEGVQRMAHQNDGQETECTEKDGWCIPDFVTMSRDILVNHTHDMLWSSSFQKQPHDDGDDNDNDDDDIDDDNNKGGDVEERENVT